MNEKPAARGRAEYLLDRAYVLEQRKIDFYRHSLRNLRDPGLVKMLASMTDREERHCQTLREYLERPDTEQLFRLSGENDLPTGPDELPDGGGEDLVRLLLRIAELESGTAAIYEHLAAASVEDEAAHLMRSLADEERKHARWADDRRELEGLR